MLVSLGLCLPSATTSDVSLNNVILSTPIVCIVLVIINIFIILHGHTMEQNYIFEQALPLPFPPTRPSSRNDENEAHIPYCWPDTLMSK